MFMRKLDPRRALAAAIVAIAGLAAVATSGTPAQAYNPPYAAIVVDVKTGKTLHAENADAIRYPASITKVMTLYLVFERLEQGRLRLDTPLNVSRKAAAEPPSKLGLRPGSTITVENAILALVTRSANDVAAVIAENLGGSIEGFAREMTSTAHAMGMTKTVFRNPHGLPNRGQVTTARDLTLLAIAVQDRFPEYYKYFQRRSFTFSGKTHRNHNRLLGRVEGVDGIKTGFIRASGFNLMTNAKTRDRHIVTIVLGGRSGAHRDGIVERLVQNNLPRAYAGARQTPRMTGGRAFAAAPPMSILPPVRPAELGRAPVAVAVASAQPVALDPRQPLDLNAMRPAFASAAGATATTTPSSLRAQAPANALAFAATESTGSIPLPPADIGTSRALPVVQGSTQVASAAPVAVPVAAPPAAAPTPVAEPRRSTWVIQIGALDSENAARRVLERAQSQAKPVLRNADPFTEEVNANGTTLYRARFSGFDAANDAENACRQLKRSGFACFASRS
ncbi:MAG TPA: D-alanyl-D-alanine carboxypeptidase [Saliniramus sp.]|nr:D-alanyl-D-alanine carboxypeptidase [Saliniramus sp.]